MNTSVCSAAPPIFSRIIRVWGRLFGRPSCRRFNNLLINLGAGGLGVGHADARTNGEARLLRSRLGALTLQGRAPVVWDVGANEGDYSALVLEYCPAASVHAFEPHPETHARLAARFAGTSVRAHQVALGASSQARQLWDYADRDGGSSHATFYPDIVARLADRSLRPVDVGVTTIDEVAGQQGVDVITLLKLDVEGHELACLDGAVDTLSRGAISMVQFEFNAMHLDARVHMGDFAERLRGFDLFRILPYGLVRIDRRDVMISNLYRMQNIFAVRNPRPVAAR